jgi:hypothetical protein
MKGRCDAGVFSGPVHGRSDGNQVFHMSTGQQNEERPSDEGLNELIASYRSLLAGEMNGPQGDVRALTERARASSDDREFIALVLGKLARKSLRGEAPRYDKDSVRPFLDALVKEMHPTRVELAATYGNMLSELVDENGRKIKESLIVAATSNNYASNSTRAAELVEIALIRLAEDSLNERAPRFDQQSLLQVQAFADAIASRLVPRENVGMDRSTMGWRLI